LGPPQREEEKKGECKKATDQCKARGALSRGEGDRVAPVTERPGEKRKVDQGKGRQPHDHTRKEPFDETRGI